jgi:hypothetical protein
MMAMVLRVCKVCRKKCKCQKWRRTCKNCMNARSRQWRIDNPERAINKIREWRKKNPHKQREYHINNFYDFSKSIMKFLINWRKGKCAICEKKLNRFGRSWNEATVEHDHKTGNFRGVACGRCNRVLGMVGDNIQLLQNLILYLQGERPSYS